jgi:hypothetical protein
VAFGEEETNTGGMEDTLKFESVVAHKRKNLSAGAYILHGEALFVVAASDFEDVAFEFVSNGVSSDFLANLHRMSILFQGEKGSNYPLVHECAQPTLIFDFNELLTAIGRIGDLETVSTHPSTLGLQWKRTFNFILQTA